MLFSKSSKPARLAIISLRTVSHEDGTKVLKCESHQRPGPQRRKGAYSGTYYIL